MTEESHLGKFLYVSGAASAASAIGLMFDSLPQDLTGNKTLHPPSSINFGKQSLGFFIGISAANALRAAIRTHDTDFRKWVCRTFCVGNLWFLGTALLSYNQGYRPKGAELLLWGVPGIAWAVIEGAICAYYGFFEDLSIGDKKATGTWKKS